MLVCILIMQRPHVTRYAFYQLDATLWINKKRHLFIKRKNLATLWVNKNAIYLSKEKPSSSSGTNRHNICIRTYWMCSFIQFIIFTRQCLQQKGKVYLLSELKYTHICTSQNSEEPIHCCTCRVKNKINKSRVSDLNLRRYCLIHVVGYVLAGKKQTDRPIHQVEEEFSHPWNWSWSWNWASWAWQWILCRRRRRRCCTRLFSWPWRRNDPCCFGMWKKKPLVPVSSSSLQVCCYCVFWRCWNLTT